MVVCKSCICAARAINEAIKKQKNTFLHKLSKVFAPIIYTQKKIQPYCTLKKRVPPIKIKSKVPHGPNIYFNKMAETFLSMPVQV